MKNKMPLDKNIPLKKRSKKARRAYYSAMRRDWGALCPVTRKPPNPKAYDRNKARRQEDSYGAGPCYSAQKRLPGGAAP